MVSLVEGLPIVLFEKLQSSFSQKRFRSAFSLAQLSI